MLRIATFNVENLGEEEAINLQDRFLSLRPILQRINADVLCLQEVNAQEVDHTRDIPVLRSLLKGTEYEHFHIAHTLGNLNKRLSDKHNLVTLSRFPIKHYQQYSQDLIEAPLYHPTTEIDGLSQPKAITWERPILYCEIGLPKDGILHCINLHLKAPLASRIQGQKDHQIWKSVQGWAEGYFIASIKRGGQALEARMLVDRILADDMHALVAVCGDFNSEENEVPLRIMMASEMDVGSAHLSSSSMIMAELSVPKDLRFSVLHHGRPQMLDHILISRQLYGYYTSCEIHNETIGDELFEYMDSQQTAGSSHAPLIASFNLG